METTAGTWDLATEWTGCESYLFLQDEPQQNGGWPTPAWDRDHEAFLEALPLNTHVFFASEDSTSDDRLAILETLKADMDTTVGELDAERQEWLPSRLHYVKTRSYSMADPMGDAYLKPGWGVGVDRFQRFRHVGNHADYERYDNNAAWFEPNLKMVANEPIYYNFVWMGSGHHQSRLSHEER